METMNVIELEPRKWMQEYFEYLTNYAKAKLSDEVLIEDLVQDTFLAALISAKNFKGKSSERTWLTSILKHKIIDQYRKINTRKGEFHKYMIRQSGFEEQYHREISIDDPNTYQADAFIRFLDFKNIIEDAKQKLTKKEREAFELKIMKGYDNEFICKTLHINRQNLWVILHRARNKMKKTLQEEWYN